VRFIYQVFIQLYGLGIHLASPFNPKAKEWIRGRKNVFEKLEAFQKKNPKSFWIHCASLGEFEQSVPLWQGLQQEYPDHKILLSFFSPSGFKAVQGKYPEIESIYLPLDSMKNAARWLKSFHPKAAFFIKYEFWENYLSCLSKHNIPSYLVSANFRKEQSFFRKGPFSRAYVLKNFTHLFVQNDKSQALLDSIGMTNHSLSGDTRFERVLEISEKEFSDSRLEAFCKNAPIFFAGSIWPSDHDILLKMVEMLPSSWKCIFAPHAPESFNYPDFGKKASKLSDFNPQSQLLYIDEVGILSKAYRYGDVAYIGGGYGKGIHNILEPISHKLAVFFGPNHKKFNEAIDLSERELVFETNDQGLNRFAQLLADAAKMSEIGQNAYNFVRKKSNASKHILVYLKKGNEI